MARAILSHRFDLVQSPPTGIPVLDVPISPVVAGSAAGSSHRGVVAIDAVEFVDRPQLSG